MSDPVYVTVISPRYPDHVGQRCVLIEMQVDPAVFNTYAVVSPDGEPAIMRREDFTFDVLDPTDEYRRGGEPL